MKRKYALSALLMWVLLAATPAFAHEGSHFGDGYDGLIVAALSLVVGLGAGVFHRSQRSYKWSYSETIITLAVATGVIHLILGVQASYIPFLLNAAAFFALLVLHYWPPQAINWVRPHAYTGLMILTATTIVAYIFLEGFNFEILSGLTKLIEVGLLGTLVACAVSVKTSRRWLE